MIFKRKGLPATLATIHTQVVCMPMPQLKYILLLLLLDSCNRSQQQSVALVQRCLPIHHRLAEQWDVVPQPQVVREVEEKVEICQHVHKCPPLLTSSVD